MNRPQDLVKGPDGEIFGAIPDDVAAAVNCMPGPICLPYGHEGFGEQHVENNLDRMKQIQGLKFARFAGFAHYIASGYDWIGQGDRERLLLVRQKDSYDLTLIIQPEKDLGRWDITTGYVKRVQDRKRLWERSQEGRSEPSTDVVKTRPRFETLTLVRKSNS